MLCSGAAPNPSLITGDIFVRLETKPLKSALLCLLGRFVQVSGIKFTFDGKAEPGSRIDRQSVMTGDASSGYVPLVGDKKYSVSALGFAAKGNEGYKAFTEGVVRAPHSMDCNRTRWPESPRIVMRCTRSSIEWP